MADRIDGIAILEERTPGPSYLYVVCVRESGDRPPWRCHVEVRPEGTPEIPGQTTWRYKIDGEFLDCAPSVKISDPEKYDDQGHVVAWKEIFHNTGNWRVRFERNNEGSAWARLRALNPSLLAHLDHEL